MENLYTINCDMIPKHKITEVLKYNNFHFFPHNPKPEGGFGRYILFSEDKMWFIKRAVLLNHIIIGCTFREDTNDSAFNIYFPNQVINSGFNFNPEFSKNLIGMNDFEFDSSIPILSINLNKKNIDKLINENDITFENTQIRASKRYKSVNFEVTKRKGVEKLFLYKQKDFYIVIGWILQGRRNRNTVIYNKNFTEFLMSIIPFSLDIPKDIDHRNTNKNHTINEALESKNNVSKSDVKQKNNPWQDYTPSIDRINTILDKISTSGIKSLTVEEITFLDNPFDTV